MRKPSGSLMRLRFSRMASAVGPSWAMVFMSRDWPVVFIERMRSRASSLVGAAMAAAQLSASRALRVRRKVFMARTSGHRHRGRSSCCYGVPGAELRFRQLQVGGMQDRLQVFVAQFEGHPQFLQNLVVADLQFQRRCRAAF